MSETDRHHLFEAARTGAWGERAGATLMALLPPVGWADVATKADLAALGAELRGEMGVLAGELRTEMAELRIELKGEMAELRGELTDLRGELHREVGRLDRSIGELRGDLGRFEGSLRSEMAGIRAEIVTQTRYFMLSLVGLFLAGTGVAFGVAQLAG